jgi:hypothetical protein
MLKDKEFGRPQGTTSRTVNKEGEKVIRKAYSRVS